jgi:alkylation response protein AidB-like acyl-CoA dehydrogenase
MSSEALEAFRTSARDLLGGADQLQRIRTLRAATPPFERGVWSELAAAGWLSILVPEAFGGLELGLREVAAIAEQVGESLLPEPFVAAGVQAIAVLGALPDSELKKQLLAGAGDGSVLLGVAWQEQLGHYDTARIATRATRAGEQWRIDGEKNFVQPASGADGWLVSAQGDGVARLLWVPADTAGLRVEEAQRVDGSSAARLVFEAAAVPLANELAMGGSVEFVLTLANDITRIAQSAELLGIARRSLALMLDYLRTREQFGKPIGSYQALQHRAVDAYIQVQLAAACLEDVLKIVEQDDAALPAMAARAKARCAHAAIFIARMAIQFHGAMGYTDECAIGFYLKRAFALAAWLGNAPQSRQRFFTASTAAQPAPEAESVDAAGDLDIPRVADWNAMPDLQFRQIVRTFFMRAYPPKLRFWPRRLRLSEAREWYQALSQQGWLAPSWPQQYGGMGLGPEKLLAFNEEIERWGVCRVPDMGIIMTGPILMRYGTPEQIDYYLPKIISGEHIWCQGYSEPNAGSDLASLRTEAVIDGDDFVINGQKIWTTWGHDATHMFMLVRTDKTVKKQQGISFVLVDMKTPGITVRPIVDIAGNEEFCEVFFDDVRVPRANLVGELNQGWTVAKSLLGFERLFVGSPKQSQHALKQLDNLARARQLFADPAFVARYAELQLDVIDLGAVYGEYGDMVKRGEELPPSISMLKIWASETYARISMALVEAAEEFGAASAPVQFGGESISVMSPLFISTASTIYGGSCEIQRNIMAKAVLDLPG